MNVNNVYSIGKLLAATPIRSYAYAATAAGTDLAEDGAGPIGSAASEQVGAVTFTPFSAGLTASTTAYVTISVYKRTNGGSAVLIAQATTNTTVNGGTGSWTQWVPVTIPLQAGAFLTASDVITVATTHAAGGTAVPNGVIDVFPTVN